MIVRWLGIVIAISCLVIAFSDMQRTVKPVFFDKIAKIDKINAQRLRYSRS